MSACADMCRDMPTLWVLAKPITSTLFRYRHLGCAGMCQHRETCRHVPTCADMCRHVPTCDINLDTSYSYHLDVIQMLTCVATGGNADMSWYVPTCADMCQHVKPLSAPLIPTIWTLSCMLACVSTFGHADMCWYVPTCADMCWHVPTCASMWHQSWHLL